MKLQFSTESNNRKLDKFALPKFSTILNDTATVFWGEWLDLRARVAQIAATGLISPLIYIFAFGLGLGSAIDSSIEPSAGANYSHFK